MRLRSILLLLALALIATPALSAEGDLVPVADALAKVRATHGVNQERDAGPELTPVKQALRAWIEPQLQSNPKSISREGVVNTLTNEDLEALSARLNTSLDAAGLMCADDESPANPCADNPTAAQNERGYVGGVSIGLLNGGRYLLVVTAVGIKCGYDQSAYIYKHGADRHWTLLLSAEQNRYGGDEYAPQMFVSIGASSGGTDWDHPSPPLIVALGFHPWCSSNWQMLYTRLWRASDTNPTPHPLLDRSDSLYTGVDRIAAAMLTPTDLLIEYRGDSIDGGTIIRTHVLHYRIQPGDKLDRIAPVALSPNDFVEEWLTSPWPEATRWSDPAAKPAALAAIHPGGDATDVFGEFDGPAKRCRTDPTLWQASFSRSAGEGKSELPLVYYKVRWMAPYRFTLIDGGSRPFPECDEEVVMPDDVGTLFPLQEWVP